MPEKIWVVYLLECADGTYYTGITNDLQNRLAAHNAGTGARYTRGRGPVSVIALKNCSNRSEASKIEALLKKQNRSKKPTFLASSAALGVPLAIAIKTLVSLFIRTTDLGFLKSLCSKARFFDFGPARKIRDTNEKKDSLF